MELSTLPLILHESSHIWEKLTSISSLLSHTPWALLKIQVRSFPWLSCLSSVSLLVKTSVMDRFTCVFRCTNNPHALAHMSLTCEDTFSSLTVLSLPTCTAHGKDIAILLIDSPYLCPYSHSQKLESILYHIMGGRALLDHEIRLAILSRLHCNN